VGSCDTNVPGQGWARLSGSLHLTPAKVGIFKQVTFSLYVSETETQVPLKGETQNHLKGVLRPYPEAVHHNESCLKQRDHLRKCHTYSKNEIVKVAYRPDQWQWSSRPSPCSWDCFDHEPVKILTLSLISCVTISKLFNLYEVSFHHLYLEDSSTCLMVVL
jgi:hypothetical protein